MKVLYQKDSETTIYIDNASIRKVTNHIGCTANRSAMGVEKEILVEAPIDSPLPSRGSTITVHCTGYGKDGDLSLKFWSTKDAGQEPFTFSVGMGQVIKGWDEGMLTMKLGEKAILKCSADYAYGESGFPAWGFYPTRLLTLRLKFYQSNKQFVLI